MNEDSDFHMNFQPHNPQLILIVEDNQDVAAFLCELLRRAGFSVCHAATAQQGLALALERLPTLAVLDIDLPDFNGMELCRRLKADSRTLHMPVIFCSGELESRVDAFAAGGVDFIAKPHEAITLPARIRQVLEITA